MSNGVLEKTRIRHEAIGEEFNHRDTEVGKI
jgi:hypothetical protein